MKTLLIIVLLAIPLCAIAQDKIEGIGKFKIGKTTLESIAEAPKKITKKAHRCQGAF